MKTRWSSTRLTARSGHTDEMYSLHPGGANVLMGDGSVRFVKQAINLLTWAALSSRSNGEVISADCVLRSARSLGVALLGESRSPDDSPCSSHCVICSPVAANLRYGSSKNRRELEALLTAISLKNAKELEKDIKRIDDRHASGELSDDGYKDLQR